MACIWLKSTDDKQKPWIEMENDLGLLDASGIAEKIHVRPESFTVGDIRGKRLTITSIRSLLGEDVGATKEHAVVVDGEPINRTGEYEGSKRRKISGLPETIISGAAPAAPTRVATSTTSTNLMLWHLRIPLAKKLADCIVERVVANSSFEDPNTLFKLPFPTLAGIPDRFKTEGGSWWRYMGREKYREVRNAFLRLRPTGAEGDCPPDLPVKADATNEELYDHSEAVLWGNLGNGKSHILAALACDLMCAFRKMATGEQQYQRVVYLPDCRKLLHDERLILEMQKALILAYADDSATCMRIAALQDDVSMVNFYEQEASKGVRIYLIVDQDNELDPTHDVQKRAAAARKLIVRCTSFHVILRGACANNDSCQKWKIKQLNITKIWLFGGFTENEYSCWKRHFATPQSTLAMEVGGTHPIASTMVLSEEEEERVKDATGCLPLFLQCWCVKEYDETPKEKWERFVNMPVVTAARHVLRIQVCKKLAADNNLKEFRDMYMAFMTGDKVQATEIAYDCQYLYVDTSQTGRCVCGLVRNILAEEIQHIDRDTFLNSKWKSAISRETQEPHPNLSLLGFLVEQQMLAQAWKSGIPLYAENVKTLDNIVYFNSKQESTLGLVEGCILYVPSAFNYKRVDAIVREWAPRSKPGRKVVASLKELTGASPPLADILKSYQNRNLHVAAVQITIGDLDMHMSSEKEFWNPEVSNVWFQDENAEDAAKWFIWYARASCIKKKEHAAEEMYPYMYAGREIQGTTRKMLVKERSHVTVFLPVEQFEPSLKYLKGNMD